MPHRLEIALKNELFDAEGAAVAGKAAAYFGIRVQDVRAVHIVTLDADLSPEQLETVRTEIFTNPVTQVSSFAPLDLGFDWCIWVGYRPGVKDTPGQTAIEAMEDVLGIRLAEGEGVFT
jgi:phosphoribosylformylglycinamidine synthase